MGIEGTVPPDIATDIAVHAALATGIHGVGASTVESVAGSQSKVDAHKDLATGVHGAGSDTLATNGMAIIWAIVFGG